MRLDHIGRDWRVFAGTYIDNFLRIHNFLQFFLVRYGHSSSFTNSPGVWPKQQSLLLRIWEVASSEPRVEGLLAAVADILVGVVPFSDATLICFGPEGPRVCGTHMTKSLGLFPGTEQNCAHNDDCAPTRRRAISICISAAYEEAWFQESHSPAPTCWPNKRGTSTNFTSRAWALEPMRFSPLILCQEIVGAAIFSRTEPDSFTSEQLAILRRFLRPWRPPLIMRLKRKRLPRESRHSRLRFTT